MKNIKTFKIFTEGVDFNIDKKYLKENNNDNLDYDLIDQMMSDAGWGDIMNTERVEDFENSDYFSDNRLITIFKSGYEKEYAHHFDIYMTGISDGTIDESVKSLS
jgi:hypothetical protein